MNNEEGDIVPKLKEMFEKWKTPHDFILLPVKKLEKELYGIGFYRVKARKVKELSKVLLDKYHGEVPKAFEELISLPGIGRKTANCVLAYTFHTPAIAVDTHVHRISNRLGWVQTKTPEETEQQLHKLVPRELWIDINRLFVGHGQTLCAPRQPHCAICPVLNYCQFGQKQKIGR